MKVLLRTDLAGMTCSATFSDDEAYRLELVWRWSDAPLLTVWMLNPSTATHEVLDPTVYGLIQRAKAWGFGGVRVINLFALRATEPKVMMAHPEPIGAENNAVIRKALLAAFDDGSPVIAGWGKHGSHLGRDQWAIDLARELGVSLYAFKLNQDGSPCHPLYLPRDLKPYVWRAG